MWWKARDLERCRRLEDWGGGEIDYFVEGIDGEEELLKWSRSTCSFLALILIA